MASGGIGNQSPATIFQARLDTTLGVSSTLTLGRYIGNKVVVSGVTVSIPPTGLARNVADNLIDATGADSGAPGAASTLYYVYVSNILASFSPETIRLSATAPTLVNGVRYLGSSGDPLNWRFVGWVRLNATPQFESTLKNRLIINYYNRFTLRLYTPASGDFSSSSTTFVEVDPTGSLRVSFISNGEDSVRLDASAALSASNLTVWASALGIDSTTVPDPIANGGRAAASVITTTSAQKQLDLSEGFHFATMLYANNNAFVLTASAADSLLGSGVKTTYVDGSIQG